MYDFVTLIRTLLNNTRNLMLEDFDSNCCIATTAVIKDICEHFNIKVIPIMVRVQILNKPIQKYFKKIGFKRQLTKEEIEECHKEGDWVVEIGYPEPNSNK